MLTLEELTTAAWEQAIESASADAIVLLERRGIDVSRLPDEAASAAIEAEIDASGDRELFASYMRGVSHWQRSFESPAFRAALERAVPEARKDGNRDLFEVTIGRDFAVALAGLGLEVAPIDPSMPRGLSQASRDPDAVHEAFSRRPDAIIGYLVAEVPWYALTVDCVVSAPEQIARQPNLTALRRFSEGFRAPDWPTSDEFRSILGVILPDRKIGDRFVGQMFEDPDPSRSSVGFYAGYMHKGAPIGGIDESGVFPLAAVVADCFIGNPRNALRLWAPSLFQASRRRSS